MEIFYLSDNNKLFFTYSTTKTYLIFGKLIFKFFCVILGKPPGYDRVRNAEIGNKDFELDVMEEAYTSEHWIVRIYKVKDYPNRGV